MIAKQLGRDHADMEASRKSGLEKLRALSLKVQPVLLPGPPKGISAS